MRIGSPLRSLFQPRGWALPALAILTVFSTVLSACNPVVPYPAPETTQPDATLAASPTAAKPTTALKTLAPTITATPTSALNFTPADLRGTIIRYWHTWSGPAGETMQKLVDEFNLSNEWKIIVSSEQVDGLDAMDERVRAVLSAASVGGDSPEIVMGYFYHALSWDQQRTLVDLDVYVHDPTWGLTAQEQADFYPAFWEHDLMAVDGAAAGRRLGIPAQRSAQLLFYNRGWARSLGFLTPPATTTDFNQQACKTADINSKDADPDNDGTGGWIISTDYHAMYTWLSAYSRDVIRDGEENPGSVTSGQSPYRFATNETRQALRFLRELYDQRCAWLPANEYPEYEFASRLGLFSVGSLLDIPYQLQAIIESAAATGYQDDWTVIPFPSPQGKPLITVYGPSYTLLPSSPERQLAAWVFLKWLSQPQQQARLVQVSGGFPLRQSTLAELNAYSKQNPQWAAAVELLSLAQAEPALQSWSVVRWTLSDAGTQLFRSYFTLDQVTSLANYLDLTAAELHQGFLLPAPTQLISLTKTATPTYTMTPFPSATSLLLTLVPSLTPIPSPTP